MTSFLTADETRRLPALVPDPLARTEVMLWIEEVRTAPPTTPGLEHAIATIESLFRGHLAAHIVDGDLRLDLTETGRAAMGGQS